MSDEDSLWARCAEAATALSGSPVYVYRPMRIAARIDALNAVFGAPFALRYAVKSNPNPWLLRWLAGRVRTLDVSSAGEAALALSCGWPPRRWRSPARPRPTKISPPRLTTEWARW